MPNRQRRSLILAASTLPLVAHALAAERQYPWQPVRMIVPFAPGGSADVLARVVGEGLAARLGQPVVIDNRVGASGNLGTAVAARAKADGYTILLGGTPPLAIAPNLYSKLGYDPDKDFAPLALIGAAPNMIVVNPSIPVETMHDLVNYAKAQPDGLSYVSAGVGGTGHLAFELFVQEAGIKAVHVPNPSPLVMTMGGHVAVCIYTASASLEYALAGKLRALAVTGNSRLALAPNVPTIAEAGFPAVTANAWYGLLAPVGVPAPIRRTISGAAIQMLADAGMRKKIEALACTLTPMEERGFSEFMKSERLLWAQAVKRANLKAE